MHGSRFPSALLFAIGALLTAVPAQKARSATLIYSNDVMGEVEPCGCRKNPQGGLLRKQELIRRITAEDPEILQLDAGNLLFASDEIPEFLVKQAEVQATYLVKGLNELGHDVAVPGLKDFALGLATFQKLRKQARFTFLAANLKDQKGKPLLEGHKIFVKKTPSGGSLRIGVFGIVGNKLQWRHGLKAIDPIQAAKTQVAELKRAKVDLIIGVTHQGLDADKELAAKVSGIDIIVGAHTQSFLQIPEKSSQTIIYQSSFRNQYVGVVPLTKPFSGEKHELIGLDEGYDTPTPTPLSKLVSEFKAEIAKVNTADSEKLLAMADSVTSGRREKYQTFPRCAECHAKPFDFWRKTPHGNALESLLKAGQIRNKECLGCHTLGLGDKKGFTSLDHMGDLADGHSQRYLGPEAMSALLKTLHHAKTPEEKIKLTPEDKAAEPAYLAISRIRRSWAPVQCENCHGPGQDHPFSAGYSKAVNAAKVCVECHTIARAPAWYDKNGKLDLAVLEAKKKSVACPPEEMSE